MGWVMGVKRILPESYWESQKNGIVVYIKLYYFLSLVLFLDTFDIKPPIPYMRLHPCTMPPTSIYTI